jgi:ribosomal protein L32E
LVFWSLVRAKQPPRRAWYHAEKFSDLADARMKIESWRRHYKEERPHSGIGYRTPREMRLEWEAGREAPATGLEKIAGADRTGGLTVAS